MHELLMPFFSNQININCLILKLFKNQYGNMNIYCCCDNYGNI